MGVEVELKLLIFREAATHLRRHDLLDRFADGKAIRRVLFNTYYDTSDFQLHASAMALRVRCSENRWVQTLKTAGTSVGGLSQRGEWQWELASQGLEPERVPDSLWPAGLKGQLGRLQAAFHTDFQRETRSIRLPAGTLSPDQRDAVIEVAWDHGRIYAAGDAETDEEEISEIEMELTQGSAVTLFDFAIAVTAGLPVFPSDVSKAERGYRLRGLPVTGHGKNCINLEPKGAAEAFFSICMENAFGSWTRHVEACCHGGAPDALGGAMGALADMRWLLAFFRSLLPEKSVQTLRASLAAATGRIAERRKTGLPGAGIRPWNEADGALALALAKWIHCREWQKRWENHHRRAALLSLDQLAGEKMERLADWFASAEHRWTT